jgi:hypothetical protein
MARARKKARECHRKLHEGIDLLAETSTARRVQAAAPVHTFGGLANLDVDAHRRGAPTR